MAKETTGKGRVREYTEEETILRVAEIRQEIDALSAELMFIVNPNEEEVRNCLDDSDHIGICDACIAGYVYDKRSEKEGKIGTVLISPPQPSQ